LPLDQEDQAALAKLDVEGVQENDPGWRVPRRAPIGAARGRLIAVGDAAPACPGVDDRVDDSCFGRASA